MNDRSESPGVAGLQFFGMVSASISHEIKNVLSIINENAGLLQDFSFMIENGKHVDLKRFKTTAEKIMTQVKRADQIVKKLNSFAHSVDQFKTTIDLQDILTLFVGLAERLAAKSLIKLEAVPPAESIKFVTNSFLLQNLLWRCLDLVTNSASEEQTLDVAAQKTENGAAILFTGIKTLPPDVAQTFPGEREKPLLEALRADLTVDAQAGKIVIHLTDIK